MRHTLDVVVGAQYGSEAKGHCVQALASERLESGGSLDVVRVAGPNAGHTGYDQQGRKWALRQVPVAAVVPGPINLVIGPGSEVDLPVLLDELDRLRDAGLLDDKTVQVSSEATLIDEAHKRAEANSNLVSRVGSTGKGIGAARAGRIMRTALRVFDSPAALEELGKRGVQVLPADHNVAHQTAADHIIVEGTQGYALGLHAGYYPQCTSSNTRAIDFLAMAGINPWALPIHELTIWLVARIYPIRVAGNSGPMRNETTWEDLGLEPERTTVTNKVRRVGEPDWDLVRRAADANGRQRCRLAVFMTDQMFPEAAGVSSWGELPASARDYLTQVAVHVDAPLGMVGTGPDSRVIL